ncbi:MAG: iron chaperone [Nitrospiria bacterium]
MKTRNAGINSIDQYLHGFPEAIQIKLSELRSTIRLAAPQAIEKISYRIPTFYYNGNLVHFAAFKNHIGFYPASSGIREFKEQLTRYKTSRGTVQFPLDKPLPIKLIKKIVEFRVKENSIKKANVERK